MSNAAAAAGKRVRARKHSGASQNSWQSKLRPYLFIAPLVILSGVFIYYCIGFTVAILLFSSVRERLEDCDCPKAFRGFPIALLAAGLLALSFMGFSGFKVFG